MGTTMYAMKPATIVTEDEPCVATPTWSSSSLAVASAPLPAQDANRGRLGVRDYPSRTRSLALAALLADPDLRRAVGVAWPLYLMLILDWSGEITGTRDEIGTKLGEDGRNVGNWVGILAEAGVATVERIGRRMKVSLVGEHLEVARMPDAVTVVDVGTPQPVLDGRSREVLDLMDRARALGGEAEVRITVRSK